MPYNLMMSSTETRTRECDTSGRRLSKMPDASIGLCFDNQALTLKSQPPIYTKVTFNLPITKKITKSKKRGQSLPQIMKTKKTRPPSGYNIFFHMVRENIVQLHLDIKSCGRVPSIKDISRYNDFNPCRIAKAAVSLRNKPKRKHVKVQDSYLSFHELTRIVADSWKNLLPSIRAMFTSQANIEFEHHQQLEWKQADISSVENKNQASTLMSKCINISETHTEHQSTYLPKKSKEQEKKECRSQSKLCKLVQIPEMHTEHQSPYHLKKAKKQKNIQKGCRSQVQCWQGNQDAVISYGNAGHEKKNMIEHSDPCYSSSIVLMMMEEKEWQKTRIDQANQSFDSRSYTLIKNEQANKIEVQQTDEFTDDWNVNEIMELNHTNLPIRLNPSCVNVDGALGSYCFNPIQDNDVVDPFSFHQNAAVLSSELKSWGFPENEEKSNNEFFSKEGETYIYNDV